MKMILSFDPATKTGWAFGPSTPNAKPAYGVKRLKKSHEPQVLALLRLRKLFQDIVFRRNPEINGMLYGYGDAKPDLVVFEEPIDPHTWFEMSKKRGRPQNGASLIIQNGLANIIEEECYIHGIDCHPVRRQTVLKHVIGTSRPGGREEGKRRVIERMHKLELLHPSCNDDDIADALANHQYASAVWGNEIPKELVLFGEK